jgi:hypothetical protein
LKGNNILEHFATAKKDFSPLQRKVFNNLLSCSSIQETAKKSKCNRSTVYRYLDDPEFSRKLNRVHFQLLSSAVGILQDNSERASVILLEIADNTETPAGVRLSACRAILETGFKGAELLNLEQRITDLEEIENE